jgi:PKD repeat protein
VPAIEAMFTSMPNIDEPLATYDFTNTSTGIGTYQWDFGDGDTSDEENPSHSFDAIGTYTVCLTLFANCDTSLHCVMITIDQLPTSVDETPGVPFELFPNPVTEMLYLKSDDHFEGLQTIVIMDANGRFVFKKDNSGNFFTNQITISMKNFPEGMYFLKMIWEDGLVSKKVIKVNRTQ